MRVQAFPEADTPRGLRVQIAGLHRAAWGSDSPHDPDLSPVTMTLTTGRTVLAALDLLHKRITHRGREYAAAGLSAVVTHPDHRGRGHAVRLAAAARAAMTADLGIFSCDRPLRSLYERAGWRHVPGAVLVGGTPDDPLPSDHPDFDKVVMAAFFTAPEGPFRDARIGLYPGAIDRLW